MGGNALQNICYTRRYDVKEFVPISLDVKDALYGIFSKSSIVPYYRNKQSFGDLDIIVCNQLDYNANDIKDALKDIFQPAGIVLNDRCFSFNYEELQVDVIVEEPKYYQTHLNYMSYNDLGNLVGRIAKSVFDVKYGHKGLIAPVRMDNTNVVSEIELSLDTYKMLSFLGFDPARFFAGFDEVEEVFEYVVGSKYFNAEFFDLENLNHINRTRNRKRENYQKFLKFLEDNKIEGLKNLPIYDANSFFPEANLNKRKEEIIGKATRYKNAKELVISVARTMYEREEISIRAAKLKVYLESIGNYEESVEKMTKDEIAQLLKEV